MSERSVYGLFCFKHAAGDPPSPKSGSGGKTKLEIASAALSAVNSIVSIAHLVVGGGFSSIPLPPFPFPHFGPHNQVQPEQLEADAESLFKELAAITGNETQQQIDALNERLADLFVRCGKLFETIGHGMKSEFVIDAGKDVQVIGKYTAADVMPASGQARFRADAEKKSAERPAQANAESEA